MSRTIAALAALALAAPAAAQEPGFRPEGLYLFHTFAQVDDRPVCSEAWDFRPDGTLAVESGAERVLKRWRLEPAPGGVELVSVVVETNRKPDCTGNRSKGPRPDERRTLLVPLNDGTVLTCPPAGRAPDGAAHVANCYGKIVPADMAG